MPPRSALGKAMNYAHKQRPKLIVYVRIQYTWYSIVPSDAIALAETDPDQERESHLRTALVLTPE